MARRNGIDSTPSGEFIPAFLRIQHVICMTGLGRTTIYRMVAENRFPRPVRVGTRAVAWRREDLEHWNQARPSATH